MSLLRNQLRKLLPRFTKEANKIINAEARSRWMRLRKITESTKSLAQACRFYGMSEDSYSKWGKRLLRYPRAESLESKSRKPYRSPNKTKPRIEKAVLKIRRVEPYLGPDRLSNEVKKLFDVSVPPSTCFAILKRGKVVGKKVAQKLTKRHMRRYRRPLPGYLQMDFKYVPYLIEGKQYYQLSCVDHHSTWRLIRCYRRKDRKAVAKDLKTIYTAATEEDAQLALTEFNDIWGQKYPHILQSWLNNWNELSTFFKYPKSIQTLIYTTNPIESLNANIKRNTKLVTELHAK